MSQRYCSLCGFDLEECPGCGFTRDPEEQETCPQCGANVPNERIEVCCYFDPIIAPVEHEETLALFPSL